METEWSSREAQRMSAGLRARFSRRTESGVVGSNLPFLTAKILQHDAKPATS